MAKYSICIIEDEDVIGKYIEKICTEYFDSTLQIKRFNTILEGKDWLTEKSIDLLLLDLNINGKDGFKLLENVCAESFQTIVISAYRERAIEAFDIGVLDFVGKPFSSSRLCKALDRFTKNIGKNQLNKIPIKKHNGLIYIEIKDIISIKGSGNYSEVYLKNNTKHLYSKSLDNLVKLLPENFLRIHKSYIANLEEIARLESIPGSKYIAHLTNQSQIPVSRNEIKNLRKSLSI